MRFSLFIFFKKNFFFYSYTFVCLFIRRDISTVVYLFTCYCLGNKQKKVTLNSSDELFADLRDLHFASVGPYLSRRAKNLNVVMDERHMAQSVSQLRVFVAKIPHIQVGTMDTRLYN